MLTCDLQIVIRYNSTGNYQEIPLCPTSGIIIVKIKYNFNIVLIIIQIQKWAKSMDYEIVE